MDNFKSWERCFARIWSSGRRSGLSWKLREVMLTFSLFGPLYCRRKWDVMLWNGLDRMVAIGPGVKVVIAVGETKCWFHSKKKQMLILHWQSVVCCRAAWKTQWELSLELRDHAFRENSYWWRHGEKNIQQCPTVEPGSRGCSLYLHCMVFSFQLSGCAACMYQWVPPEVPIVACNPVV